MKMSDLDDIIIERLNKAKEISVYTEEPEDDLEFQLELAVRCITKLSKKLHRDITIDTIYYDFLDDEVQPLTTIHLGMDKGKIYRTTDDIAHSGPCSSAGGITRTQDKIKGIIGAVERSEELRIAEFIMENMCKGGAADE